jgi:hypothetical protein
VPFFAVSHPLVLGVSVVALRGVPGFLGTAFTGLLWAVRYWKTQSPRWPIFSYVLADLASVSVVVFLNRATLPG